MIEIVKFRDGAIEVFLVAKRVPEIVSDARFVRFLPFSSRVFDDA
jgi:uncharacterized membrane protein